MLTRIRSLMMIGLLALVVSFGALPSVQPSSQAHLESQILLDRWPIALVSPDQVWAQDVVAPAPPAAAPSKTVVWLVIIVPIAATILTAMLKALLPTIPKAFLPIVCVVLGSLVDWGMSYSQGVNVDPQLAAALGAAGVGLREVVDQFKQAAGFGSVS